MYSNRLIESNSNALNNLFLCTVEKLKEQVKIKKREGTSSIKINSMSCGVNEIREKRDKIGTSASMQKPRDRSSPRSKQNLAYYNDDEYFLSLGID